MWCNVVLAQNPRGHRGVKEVRPQAGEEAKRRDYAFWKQAVDVILVFSEIKNMNDVHRGGS